MAFSGTLRRVTLVRNDVSEELSASIIRVTRIGELGTTLVVTSNRCTLHAEGNISSCRNLALAIVILIMPYNNACDAHCERLSPSS
jgi:hypothetical protein